MAPDCGNSITEIRSEVNNEAGTQTQRRDEANNVGNCIDVKQVFTRSRNRREPLVSPIALYSGPTPSQSARVGLCRKPSSSAPLGTATVLSGLSSDRQYPQQLLQRRFRRQILSRYLRSLHVQAIIRQLLGPF